MCVGLLIVLSGSVWGADHSGSIPPDS
jgi:hypothetical protein